MNCRFVCCHECDEICTIPHPTPPGRYRCPNCGHVIFRHWPDMTERIYATNLAALFLFVLINYFPLLSFEVLGNRAEATFTTAVLYLYQEGDYLIAVAVLMTTLIVPLIRILLNLALFGPLYHGRLPRYAPTAMKLLEAFGPWGMLDVFMIGILVSIVKLVKMGTIVPGISLWAFAVLIPILAYGQAIFDPHPVWEEIEKAQREGRIPSPTERIA
ncbi:paraquat-inducible protein A [Nitratifractor sp.]